MVLLFQTFVNQSPLSSVPSGLVASWSYTQYLFINIHLEKSKLSVRMSGFCWGHLGHLLWMRDGSLSWGNADCPLWSWMMAYYALCSWSASQFCLKIGRWGHSAYSMTCWHHSWGLGNHASDLFDKAGMHGSFMLNAVQHGTFQTTDLFGSQMWGFQMDM